jgi:hypothetical protein
MAYYVDSFTLASYSEVFTTVVMNVTILWDTAPCGLYVNRRFRRAYQLNLQGRKSAEPAELGCWFLARLIFNPEDGVGMLLRNVGSPTDHTALYASR